MVDADSRVRRSVHAPGRATRHRRTAAATRVGPACLKFSVQFPVRCRTRDVLSVGVDSLFEEHLASRKPAGQRKREEGRCRKSRQHLPCRQPSLPPTGPGRPTRTTTMVGSRSTRWRSSTRTPGRRKARTGGSLTCPRRSAMNTWITKSPRLPRGRSWPPGSPMAITWPAR